MILSFSLMVGSSPRLRGTPVVLVETGHVDGIIPALAGNTGTGGSSQTKTADHPRACGEHSVDAALIFCVMGSSPRLRGTQAFQRRTSKIDGIIPALAGNTAVRSTPPWTNWDHPRACGEHDEHGA